MRLPPPHALPFFVTALVVLGMFGFGVVYRRRSHVLREYAILTAGAATHTLAYALELSSTSLEQMDTWHRGVWLGMATTPTASLALALRFAHKRVRWPVLAALATFSAVFVVLAWTNGVHHHWLEGPSRLVEIDGYQLRTQDRGPVFWVYFLGASACAISTLAIYGAIWLSGPSLQRRQARILFFAILTPLVLNLVFLTTPTPIRYAPIALCLSALGLGWTFFRDGFLDLVPVAQETVVASLADPIVVLDHRRRVVDANPAARELASGALTLGAPVEKLFPFLADEVAATGAQQMITVGGRSFEVRARGIARLGQVVTLHDVTAREAHVQATQRALEVRSEFIARMSHELRTPLQGIIGALELLDRTGLEPVQSHHVATARTSARVLLAQIDDILDFERTRDGLRLADGTVDPRAIIDDVVTAVGATAKLKGLSIATEMPPGSVPLLRGDARRIRQIVLNLAANAVKFTPHGEVRITLAIARSDASSHPELTVRVEDTGPGIPEDRLPQMFEPFVQLDETRARAADGVGLGLAICRRLADAMNGRLALANRPEGGLVATFSVSLPEAAAIATPAAPARPATSRLTARVLVVENHPVSRAVVTQMLEELGAQVVAVEGGESAVDAARTSAFDVVLVDLHMPGMDGVATVRALRALEAPPHVVVFTADQRPGVEETVRAAGAAALLLKPATLDALADTLRRFGRRGSAASAPARGQLVTLFSQTYPGELAQLRRAVAEKDDAACDELLHGMVGASALLGFTDVARRCDEVRAQRTTEAIDRLEAACASATEEHEHSA